MFIAEPLAKVALAFSFPEYFALMVTGLMTVTYMARYSIVKALMMACLGILIGNVGLDMISGLPRFTFGINELSDGVGVIPLIMGIFGVCEVLENIEKETHDTHHIQNEIETSVAFSQRLGRLEMGDPERNTSRFFHRYPAGR